MLPHIVTNATPRLAPEDTPNIYGPASGLRKRVCIMSPATDREAPAKTAVIILGRRKCMRICSWMGERLSDDQVKIWLGDSHTEPLHRLSNINAKKSRNKMMNI